MPKTKLLKFHLWKLFKGPEWKLEKMSKYLVARVTFTASTQFMTWMYVTSSFSVAYFHFYRKQRLYIHHKNRHFLYIRQPTHDQCMMGSLCSFPCPTNSALDIPFIHSRVEILSIFTWRKFFETTQEIKLVYSLKTVALITGKKIQQPIIFIRFSIEINF